MADHDDPNAINSGATDAQLFFQTGTIHQPANKNGKGGEYLRMAPEINPHYENFHVHRRTGLGEQP